MFLQIDSSWTLFLDRDGVINHKLDNDYVKSPEELRILPDVPAALRVLTPLFRHTFVVTNQQGIGKGLMSENDLEAIHRSLYQRLGRAASRGIDRIYYCPNRRADQAPCRKPDIGMAEQACHDFPDTDLKRALMVGDSISDMQFGRNAGMTTVLVSQDNALLRQHIDLIDFAVSDLFALASLLRIK